MIDRLQLTISRELYETILSLFEHRIKREENEHIKKEVEHAYTEFQLRSVCGDDAYSAGRREIQNEIKHLLGID